MILLGNNSFVLGKNLEKNKVTFLETDNIQETLEKPFYLFSVDKDETIPFYLKNFISWDYRIIYDPEYYAEIENIFLNNENNLIQAAYLDLNQGYEDKLHFKKNSNIYLLEKEIKKFLNSLSEKINKKPTNARFTMDKENKQVKVLKKSQTGIKFEVDKSFEKIKTSLQENIRNYYIPLVVSKNNPKINSNKIAEYQLEKLIGSGKSDFNGSSYTRIHNIKTAAKKFDGLLLEPEEEFSFIAALGKVNETTGYKEELVIKKNQTVPEFGGGICQLSTTIFRAILNTGMKITERHNHSYPVHYYDPPGTDATVYIPQPDLKFKNNTGNYVLLQTAIDEEDNKFYVEFYSKEDPFDVELIGPEVTEKTPKGNYEQH